MKKLAIGLAALTLAGVATAQTFSTGFEPAPTEAANWQDYTTGDTTVYANSGLSMKNSSGV